MGLQLLAAKSMGALRSVVSAKSRATRVRRALLKCLMLSTLKCGWRRAYVGVLMRAMKSFGLAVATSFFAHHQSHRVSQATDLWSHHVVYQTDRLLGLKLPGFVVWRHERSASQGAWTPHVTGYVDY